MASLDWFAICEYAFLANGKASMIGVFDQITVSTFPHTQPMFFVAVHLRGTPNEDVAMSLSIEGPAGQNMAELQAQGAIGPQHSAIYLPLAVGGFVFPEPGRYRFRVVIGNHSPVTRSLRLNRTAPQRPPTAVTAGQVH